LSIIQGPFSVAPCQTLVSRFATSSSLCTIMMKSWSGGRVWTHSRLSWLKASLWSNTMFHSASLGIYPTRLGFRSRTASSGRSSSAFIAVYYSVPLCLPGDISHSPGVSVAHGVQRAQQQRLHRCILQCSTLPPWGYIPLAWGFGRARRPAGAAAAPPSGRMRTSGARLFFPAACAPPHRRPPSRTAPPCAARWGRRPTNDSAAAPAPARGSGCERELQTA
jgi:hypothetical protein